MEKTSSSLVFKWLEAVWTQNDEAVAPPRPETTYAIKERGGSVPLSWEEFQRAHRSLKEGLADIRLGLESFASDGDRVTCAMVVKARNKFSGAPIAFRTRFDGRVRDGRLISASNAIDYLLTEEAARETG